jgi:hypothetical protein
MKTATPFFPGFHHILFGRRRRSALQQLEAQADAFRRASLCQLATLFEAWISPAELAPTAGQRRRCFPPAVLFWAFLSQVLSPGSACRETLRKVQGWCAAHKLPIPDSNTGGYCKARRRLLDEKLRRIHRGTADRLQAQVSRNQLWCGRRVKVIDGTGLSMPDTPKNQRAFPQPTIQKPGCGFPVVKLVGCFCLSCGAWIDWIEGTLKTHEYSLFSHFLGFFEPGDVVLADRGFCAFDGIARLQQRGVDAVMRLHQARSKDFRKGRRLGKNQRLVTWIKPNQKPPTLSAEDWSALPPTLTVRYVKVHVSIRGFRTREIIVVSTLLDPNAYTMEAIAELYFRRWSVELYLRDIKITLGMDILRCQSPEMVRKEIIMHAIAYNLIRALMQQAAAIYQVDLSRVSFKGTVDTLRQWAEPLNAAAHNRREFARFKHELLARLAEDLVPLRPNRAEPRAVKRRPKNYRRLTRPRHEMRVVDSRRTKSAGVLSPP